MDTEHIKSKIAAQAREKRIACRQAMVIAEEEGVSPKALGEILDEMGVKVISCQLGCF